MKPLLKIFVILFLFFFSKNNFAQVDAIPYYDHLNFNGAFFVIAENDAKSNFFAINLSQFTSPAEKKYFETLAFNEPKLIRLDAGNASVAWYKAKKTFTSDEISALLLSLKNQTIQHIGAMSVTEQQEWMNNNGK
jgi:hypothetical protein